MIESINNFELAVDFSNKTCSIRHPELDNNSWTTVPIEMWGKIVNDNKEELKAKGYPIVDDFRSLKNPVIEIQEIQKQRKEFSRRV